MNKQSNYKQRVYTNYNNKLFSTLTGSVSNILIYKGQGSISVPLSSSLFNDLENNNAISASSSSSIISSISANNTNLTFQWFPDKIGTLSITILWSKNIWIYFNSWSCKANCKHDSNSNCQRLYPRKLKSL